MENNFSTGRLLAFIRSAVGNPADLTTEDKENAVAAINELEERFGHYEPKLRFDPTPVYSVTLAEDASASQNSPYEINFNNGGYLGAKVYFQIPDVAQTAGMRFNIAFEGNEADYITVGTFQGTAARHLLLEISPCWGYQQLYVIGNTRTDNKSTVNRLLTPTISSEKKVMAISMYNSTTQVIPAGTQIIVFPLVEV